MSATKKHHHEAIEKGMRKLPQKEKPILFSAPMVQAILAGRKTQTRRTLKSGFDHNSIQFSRVEYFANPNIQTQAFFKDGDSLLGTKCPYGSVADLLWVRETTAFSAGKLEAYDTLSYRADDFHKDIKRAGAHIPWEDDLCTTGWHDPDLSKEVKWIPSIHMKRVHARIWLQIEEITVERLNTISEEDSIAEGCFKYGPFGEYAGSEHPAGGAMKYRAYSKASRAFQCIWDSINGKPKKDKPHFPWSSNPWVWVVKFKVLSTSGKPEQL